MTTSSSSLTTTSPPSYIAFLPFYTNENRSQLAHYEMTLEELEEITLDRIEILQLLQQHPNSELWKGDVLYTLKRRINHSHVIRNKELDTISFTMLQYLLSTCSSSSSRDSEQMKFRPEYYFKIWIEQECLLFRYRLAVIFQHGLEVAINETLRQLPYLPITTTTTTSGGSYQVPFEMALSCIRTPLTYFKEYGYVTLQKGMASVPLPHMTKVLFQVFKDNLNNHHRYYDELPLEEIDERFNTLRNVWLKALEEAKPINNKVSKTSSLQQPLIPLSELDTDKTPPCMRLVYRDLVKHHRLPHAQRTFFGVFLKHLRIPLSQALLLWNTHLRRSDTTKGQSKGYEYELRHAYGEVGARTRYSPLSCSEMIRRQCGCVFQDLETWNLFQKKQQSHVMSLLQRNPSLKSTIETAITQYRPRNACLHYRQAAVIPSTHQQQLHRNPIEYITLSSPTQEHEVRAKEDAYDKHQPSYIQPLNPS